MPLLTAWAHGGSSLYKLFWCCFILLNLVFSTQAAYAAPIIMMAQNRQSDRDRLQAQADYQTNIDAKLEIEALAIQLNTMEVEKLDKIIAMLNEMKNNAEK